MNFFTDKEDFKSHILVSNFLDLELLEPYIELTILKKINPYISNELIDELKEKYSKLYSLLKTVVAHYTIPFAIPFIKVKITNSGIVSYEDSKTKNVDWWDVRDMALQAIKIAEETLTDIIDELIKKGYNLKFLNEYKNTLFNSPSEFFSILKTGTGYELFNKLLPNIEYTWIKMIKSKLPDCVLNNLEKDHILLDFLKKSNAFFSLEDAVESGNFEFNKKGIFLIWEQLPWQKSALLSTEERKLKTNAYHDKGNYFLKLALKHIKNNSSKYPCIEHFGKPVSKSIKLKSGLYL